ncbi:MAG: diguanylate cyclase [Pseudomonadota bacterium]
MLLVALSGPAFILLALASNWLSFQLPANADSSLIRVGAILGVVIAAAVAIRYIDSHASSLQRIVDVTQRIRSGELDARALVDRNSETEALAIAVNQMADELTGALRDVERERAAVLGAVVEAVVEIDKHGRILTVNPATENLFGWRTENLLGENLKLILPTIETVAPLMSGLEHRNSLTLGETDTLKARHKDGRLFPVNLSLARRSFHGKPRFVGVITDLSEQRAYIRRLEELAFYDPLTKVPARRLVEDRLKTALSRAQRAQSRFAVLFIDIDQFKPINDHYGHAIGDMVLAVLAQRLVKTSRESDTVGRVGGDEFVVIAETIQDDNDIATLIKRYEAALNRGIPAGERDLRVGASIGAACYPSDADNPDELLRIADERMYRNKARRGSEAAG